MKAQHDEPDPNSSTALLSSAKQDVPADKASQDIGTISDKACSTAEVTSCTHKSYRGRILQYIQSKVGQRQVTATSLEFVPQWLLDEELQKEMDNNWQGAYVEVAASSIDRSANVICSCVDYKVKLGDDAHHVMKASLVRHGSHDQDCFTVRTDSASADLSTMHLSISIALAVDVATADVKGTYMQSGPIRKALYVKLPIQIAKRNTIWKLLRLPYGIVEAGRQRLCAIEQYLIDGYGLGKTQEIDQLFYNLGGDGKIGLFIAKLVDDIIIAGKRESIDDFIKALEPAFKLGQICKGDELKFFGMGYQEIKAR